MDGKDYQRIAIECVKEGRYVGFEDAIKYIELGCIYSERKEEFYKVLEYMEISYGQYCGKSYKRGYLKDGSMERRVE
jgi:hypothetical protein